MIQMAAAERKKAIEEIRMKRRERLADGQKVVTGKFPKRGKTTHLGDVSESRSTARVRKLNEEVLELIRN